MSKDIKITKTVTPSGTVINKEHKDGRKAVTVRPNTIVIKAKVEVVDA